MSVIMLGYEQFFIDIFLVDMASKHSIAKITYFKLLAKDMILQRVVN